MTCREITIRELLPAAAAQALAPEERRLVERHLALCEDCRRELAVLAALAEEPVPDPGDAFWNAMPDLVYRAVQEQQANRRRPLREFLQSLLLPPRWAWTAAALFVIAGGGWFLARSGQEQIAKTLSAPVEGGGEAVYADEPVNVDVLSPKELNAASQWAQNEFAPVRDAVVRDAPEPAQKDIDEDIMNLSPRELERVYELLKEKERELQERRHKKPGAGKSLG
jgi:hypothetical protein